MSGSASNPVIQGQYTLVAPVLATGEQSPIRIGNDAILLVTVAGGTVVVTEPNPLTYTSAGDARDGLILAGAGELREIKCCNTNAATRYLQLFDAIALPANGTTPAWTASTIVTLTEVKEVWNPKVRFGTGIYWAISTTRATLTVAGATDANVSALYEL